VKSEKTQLTSGDGCGGSTEKATAIEIGHRGHLKGRNAVRGMRALLEDANVPTAKSIFGVTRRPRYYTMVSVASPASPSPWTRRAFIRCRALPRLSACLAPAHEFFGMGAVVDKANQAVAQAAAGLEHGFGT
jgi:hypothetical protein